MRAAVRQSHGTRSEALLLGVAGDCRRRTQCQIIRGKLGSPLTPRFFIGGFDARIIMGGDEAALVQLWREKRREAEPEHLSGNPIVQLGRATEELNRSWYEPSARGGPLVGAVTGGFDFSNHFIPLSSKVTADSLAEAKKQGAVLAWGNFLTLVNFMIIAWVLFIVVKVMNHIIHSEP
jgi:Large-conductance mechanosensitive channel, MscL